MQPIHSSAYPCFNAAPHYRSPVIYRPAFVDINIGKSRLQDEGFKIASSAVLVLCLNLGRTYTFHCRRKTKRASERHADFYRNIILAIKCSSCQLW